MYVYKKKRFRYKDMKVIGDTFMRKYDVKNVTSSLVIFNLVYV